MRRLVLLCCAVASTVSAQSRVPADVTLHGTAGGSVIATLPKGSPIRTGVTRSGWTQVTIDFANTAALSMSKGTLDGTGEAAASLNSLGPQPAAPLGLTLQHCFLVYQSGPPDSYYMASNLVPWTTVP